MDQTSWVSFRHLIERNGKTSFLSFLSLSEREKYQSTVVPKTDPFGSVFSMEDRLNRIHYSWLITFLAPFSERDKEMIIDSLNGKQRERLRKYFHIKEEVIPFQRGVKHYLVRTMYEWLIADQHSFLPFEFLPDHPLNPLIDLSKKKLQRLVDFLGLHDLAVELKHVIKSDQIKKIQKALTSEEQTFLKRYVKVKAPITFSRLNLDGWDGHKEKLREILHHRGFNRLAKALFGCHPALLWHISHRLDTGRAKILRKFCTDIKNDEAQAGLTHQILELIQESGIVHG